MLEIIEPGLHSTVQDGGRLGWGHLGVRRAGAADPLALAVANLLAGAPADAPAVEMTLLGATFAVTSDVLVGLSGADMEGFVPEEGRRLEVGRSHQLRAGTTLAFGAAVEGVRAYVALAGGIDVPRALGSAATDPIAGFGGVEGRVLRAGDVLTPIGERAVGVRRWPAGEPASGVVCGAGPVVVPVVEGPHRAAFPETFGMAFVERTWSISSRSDRSGLRLEGEALAGSVGLDIVSMPMLPGAVQVPPNGQPIVLLPDAPTVGGYPVPAVVPEVGWPRLGQLRPGTDLRFEWISLDAARTGTRERSEWLAAMAESLA